VESIFKKLISNLDKEGKEINYTLCIVKNKEINAFAAPGGYIAIHSGLLDNADSDNEIAFVLAHELGHINNRDHLKTLGRSLITLIFFSALSNGSSSSFMSLITNNAENSFSRSQEKKSDIFALKLLLKTYNNADGALSFMKRIDKLMEGTKFLYYLSTHPMPDDRTDYIREFLKK